MCLSVCGFVQIRKRLSFVLGPEAGDLGLAGVVGLTWGFQPHS